MIEAKALSKTYGKNKAVDGVSFQIHPGTVTGFLGPNGAGKSTTMRMIVGLDRPTSGEVTIDGIAYAAHPAPLRKVGALLDAKYAHPSMKAITYLRALAATHGISSKRADEVLDITGLATVAKKRIKGFSLGMTQRLGIAAALLGDPEILLFDEPVNGLDPEGVKWVRELCRSLASEGRCVFISSHLMSEMALTADHVLVIGKGKIISQGPMKDFIAQFSIDQVDVHSPQLAQIVSLMQAHGGHCLPNGNGGALVTKLSCPTIGQIAAENGITLHQLSPRNASLEEAYLRLTDQYVQYRSDSDQVHAVPPHTGPIVAGPGAPAPVSAGGPPMAASIANPYSPTNTQMGA